MFTLKPPLLWFDVNRISCRDAARLRDEYERRGVVVIPTHGDGSRVIGTVQPERYPTPNELFRWTPKRA
jgi:hypothetical protein